MRVFFLFFFLSLPFSGGFYFSARRSSTAKARGHMRARCCVARRLWPPFPVSLSNSTPPRVRRPAPTGALHARSYRTLVALVFVLIPPSALAPWVSKSLTHSLPTPLSLCLSLSLSLSPLSLRSAFAVSTSSLSSLGLRRRQSAPAACAKTCLEAFSGSALIACQSFYSPSSGSGSRPPVGQDIGRDVGQYADQDSEPSNWEPPPLEPIIWSRCCWALAWPWRAARVNKSTAMSVDCSTLLPYLFRRREITGLHSER